MFWLLCGWPLPLRPNPIASYNQKTLQIRKHCFTCPIWGCNIKCGLIGPCIHQSKHFPPSLVRSHTRTLPRLCRSVSFGGAGHPAEVCRWKRDVVSLYEKVVDCSAFVKVPGTSGGFRCKGGSSCIKKVRVVKKNNKIKSVLRFDLGNRREPTRAH